jgi:hypothetical protein
MRKPESIFWDAVRPLCAGLHPVRIENAAGSGTPDVNITLGWIELKQVAAKDMPKRPDTILRIDHFTDVQRIFLLKRSRAGAACWLLLLLDREWLLFMGKDAAMQLGKLNTAATRELACRSWSAPPDKDTFQKALRETAFCMVLDGVKA